MTRARPSRPTALFVVVALAVAVAVLALATPRALAGTWNINPLIANDITSGDTSLCSGHPDWAGCVALYGPGTTGRWTSDPYADQGVLGGRLTLPGTPAPNLDQPSFDAPSLDRGASAKWTYKMPDQNGFLLSANDYVGELGADAAYPVCLMYEPWISYDYACQATFAPGTPAGKPSNSNLGLSYAFFDQSDWARHSIAAGEVCTVPGGSQGFTCAAGALCNGTDCNLVNVSGQGPAWGSTDPWQFMYLQFWVVSSAGPVSVTDGVLAGQPGDRYLTCPMSGPRQSCSFFTSGGQAVTSIRSLLPGVWPDALQVNYQGQGPAGPPAQIVVRAVAEPNLNVMNSPVQTDNLVDNIAALEKSQWNGGPDLQTSLPELRRVKVRSSGPGTARLSYRDPTSATTVVALERARRGVRVRTRWETVPGARVLGRWDTYSRRGSGGRCRAHYDPAVVTIKPQPQRCHVLVRLKGHYSHQDRIGMNDVDLSHVNGHRLQAGSYRATARAIQHGRVSRPVRVRFTVRG